MGYNNCYTENGDWECDFSKNGFRLPTEAEWEFACRAGTDTYFYTGNELSSDGETSADLDKAGWYRYNRYNMVKESHTVGAKEPNEFGLYDMHGNLWEWCNDWYGDSYYYNSPSTDPTGPTSGSGRVFRGGSWLNSAMFCRSAARYEFEPRTWFYHLGIRVVRRP